MGRIDVLVVIYLSPIPKETPERNGLLWLSAIPAPSGPWTPHAAPRPQVLLQRCMAAVDTSAAIDRPRGACEDGALGLEPGECCTMAAHSLIGLDAVTHCFAKGCWKEKGRWPLEHGCNVNCAQGATQLQADSPRVLMNGGVAEQRRHRHDQEPQTARHRHLGFNVACSTAVASVSAPPKRCKFVFRAVPTQPRMRHHSLEPKCRA